MRVLLFTSSFLLAAVSSLTAQRTWVVDSQLGPGSDFATIQRAVDAATAGDVIRVRYGVYQPFVVSKGVAIIGIPGGATFLLSQYRQGPPILARLLPAGQQLRITGFSSVASSSSHIMIDQCSGPVVIENFHAASQQSPFSPFGPPGIWISDSKAVTLNECLVGFGMKATRATVTATSSVFRRYDATANPLPVPAIDLSNATATFTHCVAVGETTSSPRAALPALTAFNSRVSIRGHSTMLGGTIAGAGAPALTADRQSTLEYDPRVTLTPGGTAVAISGFGSVAKQRLPALSVQLDKNSTLVTGEILGTHNELCILSVSTLLPSVYSTPFGDLWLDPRFEVILAAGTHDQTERAGFSVRVPANPQLAGLTLAWHTFSGPWPKLRFSNPVTTTLR